MVYLLLSSQVRTGLMLHGTNAIDCFRNVTTLRRYSRLEQRSIRVCSEMSIVTPIAEKGLTNKTLSLNNKARSNTNVFGININRLNDSAIMRAVTGSGKSRRDSNVNSTFHTLRLFAKINKALLMPQRRKCCLWNSFFKASNKLCWCGW